MPRGLGRGRDHEDSQLLQGLIFLSGVLIQLRQLDADRALHRFVLHFRQQLREILDGFVGVPVAGQDFPRVRTAAEPEAAGSSVSRANFSIRVR